MSTRHSYSCAFGLTDKNKTVIFSNIYSVGFEMSHLKDITLCKESVFICRTKPFEMSHLKDITLCKESVSICRTKPFEMSEGHYIV